METSEIPSDSHLSHKASKPIMAPSNLAPSVIVSLHPLVVMNIAEHWTRVRAQMGNPTQVFGALLGRQKGRNIELCTSFEIKMTSCQEKSSSNFEDIDLEFLNTQIGQFKQVFADLDFLGWYTSESNNTSTNTTNSSSHGVANEYDVYLHKQVCTINESPLFLKLNPFGRHTDLPVSIFESVIDFIDDQPNILFIELEYSLATDEAERIGVDHIAKHSAAPGSSSMVQSAVAEHLSAQYSAITLLHNRIKVVYEYVRDVKLGRVQKNNEILREIQSLCHRLPVMNSPNFYKEFYTLYNDVTWISYLGIIMQGSNTLNQYLNKFLIMHDKSIIKRGRSIMI